MQDLNIIIQIPFCRGNCVHCDSARCGQNIAYLHKYRRALEIEINSAADELEEYNVCSVHIKGDCVQLLGSGAMDDMLSKFRSSLKAAAEAEWVMDMMPDEIDELNLYTLRQRNNVQRIELKLFANTKQELLSIHGPCTSNITAYTLEKLAKEKVSGLDFELVLGAPGQTEEVLEELLAKILACEPCQISFVRYHNNKLSPAEQREYAEEFPWSDYIRRIQDKLTAAGFERAGKSLVFALPGMLRRENVEAGQKRDMIGFGLGAFTVLGDLSYRNTTDYTLYTEHSDDPELIAVL